MAAKKKTKKKSTKSKKNAGRKVKPTKKQAKNARTSKKLAKRPVVPHKAAARKRAKTLRGEPADMSNKEMQTKRSRGGRSLAFSRETAGESSGGQSGDLQGLSNAERADSESVDELIEEGNAFEAGVVSGVEEAGERGEKEVRTREVLEDDVPGEYLNED
jgi:hypothetical protein